MNLRDKLLGEETAYQRIAREFGSTPNQVGRIARGERKAIRGKSLAIKQRIESMIDEKEG